MNYGAAISLAEKFSKPSPYWVEEIKKEVYARIAEAPFAAECRKGNKEVMRRLIINLWPFVDVFPQLVERGYRKLLRPSFIFRYGIGNMLKLLYKSIQLLRSIGRDEKAHRILWLDTGTALGLSYPKDFKKNPTPETQRWLKSVTNNKRPFTMLLSYVAIEMIAESISKNLLAAEAFVSAAGREGARWFEVHAINHGDVSHEALEFHLAFTFHENEPREDEVSKVIQHVVSKFLDSANASV